MAEVGLKQAKAGLSELVNRAAYGRERILITSRGKAKAALISVDDLCRLEKMELQAESDLLRRAIREETEFVPVEDLVHELLESERDPG